MNINIIISIGIGLLTYFLLYLNKLQNIKNSINNKQKYIECVSNYNISLKIPLIISLIFLFILSKVSKYNTNEINNIIYSNKSELPNIKNLDVFTDNMSYFF